MSYSFGKSIVTDGLVFYVDAGNSNSYPGTGTTWSDLAGGNDGTFSATPTTDSANGGSIVFDGVNDYVSLSVPTSGDTTYCAWFKTNGSNANTRIIHANTGGQRNFSLGTPSTSGYVGGYDGTNLPATTLTFDDGNWHYAIVVMKTNDYKVYVDGQNQSLTWVLGTTGNWNNNTTSTEYIGKSAGGSYLNANLAQVKIYNRALSASEVLQNYNALKNRFI
jgi:hypothetical protein